MFNKKHFCQIFVLILSIFFLLCADLSAEWMESDYFGLCNLAFTGGNPIGYYLAIPDSPYIIFHSGNDFLIIDIEEWRLKGGGVLPHSFNRRNMSVIPDKKSGWNLFYINDYDKAFRKLHVNADGTFGEDNSLSRKAEIWSHSVGIPERYEVWYFTDKILRLNTIDEEWAEYDYPDGWDTKFDYVRPYPAISSNAVIGIAYGENVRDYQAFILDIDTGASKIIDAEDGFFKGVKDIDEWKEHPGHFIIMKKDEIYSYNSETETIELLIKDFDVKGREIMQDDNGRFLYIVDGYNRLCIVDLFEKTSQIHDIPVKEGFAIVVSEIEPVYDSRRNCLILFIRNEDFYGDADLVLLDLGDLTVTHFEKTPENPSITGIFIEYENKFLFTTDQYFYIADFGSFDLNKGIPIFYKTKAWNMIDDFNKPILLDNTKGDEFIRMYPGFRREMLNLGFEPELVCQFPEGDKALVCDGELDWSSETGYNSKLYYYDYNFENRNLNEIEFPYDSDFLMIYEFFSDPDNNQIILVCEDTFWEDMYNFTAHKVVFFVGEDYSISTWISPEVMREAINDEHFIRFTNEEFIFDSAKDLLWFKWEDNETDDMHIHKLSTKTKSHEDFFILEKDLFDIIRGAVFSPDSRFLFFINETDTNSRRELVIFDLDKSEIIKKFNLQDNIEYDGYHLAVIPCILPVPGKDRLFLWDRYGGWCIDTNTWEILYGDLKSNPQAYGITDGGFGNKHIRGMLEKNSNHIILFDYTI